MTHENQPRTIFLEHRKNGVLVDALQVTLQDPNNTYGIRELESQVIVIPPNTPVPRVGLGQYEYNISGLSVTKEYEYFFKVIDQDNQVQFIRDLIPKVIEPVLSDGPKVPEGAFGIPVDFNNDGIIDGYAYDLTGDGYHESFDLNFDGVIDAIDVGSPGLINGREFDSRGVRIGLGGGGLGGISGNFVLGELDGIPDIPSPKGTPATAGTWGSTLGFDGTSGEIPATGGLRSNRNEIGTGYWDGISFKDLCTVPIGPRGSCYKDKAAAVARAMLKDTDPTCLAFSNDEIDLYLESSLWAFNARPTFTAFLWDHLQERWLDIIVKGAVIWALYAQGLLEAGREFTISDNGISYTPPPVSDKLHAYGGALLAHYEKELAEIKSNFKPLPAAVGLFSSLQISVGLRRLRHMREKKIL